MAENYRSPYGIWWDENIQGKYGVSGSIRELMAMAFEGGRQSRDAEIEALHKLIKEQDLKIINLSFDLEYAKRTDEFVKKASEK